MFILQTVLFVTLLDKFIKRIYYWGLAKLLHRTALKPPLNKKSFLLYIMQLFSIKRT